MKLKRRCNCSRLIKAIDRYIAKANDNLSNELKTAGFATPKKTVRRINELEDELAKILRAENKMILTTINDYDDLEEFVEEGWPGIKDSTDVVEKISTTFNSRFSEDIPEYTAEYLKRVESDLVLDRVALTSQTTGWISSWSGKLGEIMKLTDNNVIEKILTAGLKNGDSIADTAKKISDSGIRDPGYRARRVAITETLRAHSVAQQESFMQSPAVEDKLWRHSGIREFARENHIAIDGQTVKKDEPFTLFGADGAIYNPMYPRDIVLPPGESINCGCIAEPIVSEYVLGLSLEERNALREEAITEMNEEYDNEHGETSNGSPQKEETGSETVLKTKEDPIREVLGSAMESHPDETKGIIKEMDGYGVGITYRENAMGYSPNPTPGNPGKIIMDPDASYSAWLHERQHAVDDKDSGWLGFRNFADPENAARFEANAYDKEIEFAKEMGYNDIVERLKVLKDSRIKEVLGDEED